MKSLNFRIPIRTGMGILALTTQLFCAGGASAQGAIPASTQFDITGFLQAATLDSSCASNANCGGTLTVNGKTVIVPRETVVIFPANALTWQEVFAQAPAEYTPASLTYSGMAMTDVPQPLTTYEVHVVGNRVQVGVKDDYIAGMINFSQQSLNAGAGYINYIDYATGDIYVGGIGPNKVGARLRINDPVGRFGRVSDAAQDPRFTVDPDNPTIISGTGFPMCLPRVTTVPDLAANPHVDDPLCPQNNRPVTGGFYDQTINMPSPASVTLTSADPRKQAPMEIGDYIMYAGTLTKDPLGGEFISAHTITSNVAIYTSPGSDPAYVMTEVTLIGTGGLTVLGAGEAVIRTRFEGMTTDPSRPIHLFGIDVNPTTGATTDRDWGTIAVDPGPPNGAVKGRWRFRPPCLVFGSVPTKPDKECVMNAAGTFLPAPREMRAVIEGQQNQVAALKAGDPTRTAANGIFYGQYHAPIGEYIFPENVPGTPIVENNFNTIDFLSQGGYASTTGVVAGVLSPWPSNVTPAGSCVAPVASAGGVNGVYTVTEGSLVTLKGSATGTSPTYAWTQTPSSTVALSGANTATATFTAPAAQTLTFQLTATACGTSSAPAVATVNISSAASVPVITTVAPVSVVSGGNGTVTLNAAYSGNTLQKAGFTVTQSDIAGLLGLKFTGTQANPSVGIFNFKAPILPLSQAVSSVVNITFTATIGTGAAARTSAPVTVPVTIVPAKDTLTLTSEYRIGKQRLVLTATSTNTGINAMNGAMTLQPYLTEQGVMFDPAALGNTFTPVGGIPTLTLVGAPPPACNQGGAYATPCSKSPLVVTSILGGATAPPQQAIQKIRN